MASLFVKDTEANELAEKLARARGLTKTAAVKLALRHELERDVQPASVDRRPMRERMIDFWGRHSLSPAKGPQADKAFFDDLSGDL